MNSLPPLAGGDVDAPLPSLCQTLMISHQMEASNGLVSLMGETTVQEDFLQAPNQLHSAKVASCIWGGRAGGKLQYE